MYLYELINRLESEDLQKVVPMGFHNPHSYRGYYDELAFEPKEKVTVEEMLKCARRAIGKTFQGWKGGEYKMGKHTNVWLAEEGHCGESIGTILLDYMLGKYE